MIEIYKGYCIHTIHQTFDDKNKNVSAKKANNNQIHDGVVFEMITFPGIICDLPSRTHCVSDDNNPILNASHGPKCGSH